MGRLGLSLLATACALGPLLAARAAGAGGCIPVPAGEGLARAVAEAPEGATLCLAPGEHEGPVVVQRRLVLRGPGDAVIRSQGRGTTVSLDAEGAALLGVTVDGSGSRHDLLDAAVRVRADHVRVEDVTIRGALFGLLAEQAHGVVLRGNEISGWPDKPLGLRGDGIRIWEVRGSRIEDNHLSDGRDIVVWYSPGNRITGNRVERSRYGTHLMYSHHNVIEDNRYLENVVGIFIMYSSDIQLRRNVFARSAGAAGVGLGLKESGDIVAEDNWFLANQVGIYLDTSPLSLDEHNQFARNVFRLGDTALVFHGVTARNRFVGNSFRDDRTHVRVESRGDARDAEWLGNDYDDYAGYDLDGDGVGDLPYELRSLSGALTSREPALAFFHGSPALGFVELIGRVVPLLQPQTLLVDPRPRMQPLPAEIPSAG